VHFEGEFHAVSYLLSAALAAFSGVVCFQGQPLSAFRGNKLICGDSEEQDIRRLEDLLIFSSSDLLFF
jgi:hypothetical protein